MIITIIIYKIRSINIIVLNITKFRLDFYLAIFRPKKDFKSYLYQTRNIFIINIYIFLKRLIIMLIVYSNNNLLI